MLTAVQIVLAVCGITAIVAGITAATRSSREATWRPVADRLGLVLYRHGLLGEISVGGELDGVQISLNDHKGDGKGPCVEAMAMADIPQDLRLERQGMLDGLRQWFGQPDLQVGDVSFDDAALVRGEPASALASLSLRARALFLSAASQPGHFVVRLGTVHRRRPGIQNDPDAIRAFAKETAALARCLSAPIARRPVQLRERVQRDPNPAVRIAALRALVDDRPTHSETARAVEIASTSSHPTVVAESRRARLCLPGEIETALLEQLFRSTATEDRLAALGAVSARQIVGVEAGVRQALEGGNNAVRIAAAEALGVVGTLSSVEVLQRIAGRTLTPSGVRDAARHAIASIQARHGSQDRGTLSVAADGEGALSVERSAPTQKA